MRQIIELLKLEHEVTRAHIAIVSSSGEVALVNKAWCDFWSSQGCEPPCGEGADIFELLRTKVTGVTPSVVQQIEAGLRDILSEQQIRYTLDFEFSTPSDTLLFKLYIRPVDLPEFQGAQLRIESRPRFGGGEFCRQA